MAENYSGIRDCIRKAYALKSIPKESIEIMISSLRQASIKQYDSGLKRWWKFCDDNKKDPFASSVQIGLEFLTSEFNAGAIWIIK